MFRTIFRSMLIANSASRSTGSSSSSYHPLRRAMYSTKRMLASLVLSRLAISATGDPAARMTAIFALCGRSLLSGDRYQLCFLSSTSVGTGNNSGEPTAVVAGASVASEEGLTDVRTRDEPEVSAGAAFPGSGLRRGFDSTSVLRDLCVLDVFGMWVPPTFSIARLARNLQLTHLCLKNASCSSIVRVHTRALSR